MIIKELISELKKLDSDMMVLYGGDGGGWANIELSVINNTLYVLPDTSKIFSDE